MMQFSRQPQTETEKIEKLEVELQNLKKIVKHHEEALNLASETLKKATEAINEISVVQAAHLEHTSTLHQEIQTILNALYPKDNIKYDLMNEPYN